MMKIKKTWSEKLVDSYRNECDFAVLLAVPLTVFCCLGFLLLSEAFPGHSTAIKFLGMGTIFAFLFAVVIPLFFIGRKARKTNSNRDLLYEALQQYAFIKDGLEPGQAYYLSEVFCLDNSNSREVKYLLESMFDENVVVVSEESPGGCHYKLQIRVLNPNQLCSQESPP